MQVFINISSKVAFILKSYVRQPSQVYQNFHGVPFPRRSQLLPEIGSNKLHFLHSAEVRYFTHERSTLCCTTGQLIPVHNSMMWGPEDDPSQSLPPSRPRMPPWCTPSPHIELRQWFIQTVRCQNYRGTLRGPTHILHILYELPINMHASRITAMTCTSGFMREEKDTSDFSVPFQISWSTRNIRR